MRLLKSTLLTGPYDWDEHVLPRSEYEERLARVRTAMAQAGASALAIHGHPGNYGALAYLTNFTRQTRSNAGARAARGTAAHPAPGTPKMMDIAKRLTWVEDVRPLGNAPKAVAEFAGEGNRSPPGRLARCRRRSMAASPKRWRRARWCRSIKQLDAMRRQQIAARARTRFAVRPACWRRRRRRLPRMYARARCAQRRAAAERAAIAAGAQDARVMASLSNGGAPLPLDAASDERVLDIANAGIAVQNHGYRARAM